MSVLSVCLSVCPVCDVGVLWPNGWTDQDETRHAGRPQPWPHCVRWGTNSPPQISAHICCGQMAAWINMSLGMEEGLGPDDIVLDGDPARTSPIFGPCLLWPNGWIDQGGTWQGGGPWSTPHCARSKLSSPPQKTGQRPQFSAHFYCGQTVGYTKMPLGMEVVLSPGDFVLNGDQPLSLIHISEPTRQAESRMPSSA